MLDRKKYLPDELQRVLEEQLDFSHRLTHLAQQRILRRATLIIAGVDYLVTHDQHLLALNPYEGLQIISIHNFYELPA